MCRDGNPSPTCGPPTKTGEAPPAPGPGGASQGDRRANNVSGPKPKPHPARTAGSSGAIRPLK